MDYSQQTRAWSRVIVFKATHNLAVELGMTMRKGRQMPQASYIKQC
jgi:hypothetical protein